MTQELGDQDGNSQEKASQLSDRGDDVREQLEQAVVRQRFVGK
jgi:hypothetical protein